MQYSEIFKFDKFRVYKKALPVPIYRGLNLGVLKSDLNNPSEVMKGDLKCRNYQKRKSFKWLCSSTPTQAEEHTTSFAKMHPQLQAKLQDRNHRLSSLLIEKKKGVEKAPLSIKTDALLS